jgi:hypothetical protein
MGSQVARLVRDAATRLGSVLLALCTPAEAGQPLFTDDAAVVAAKTCQLETFVAFAHADREYWAQPACNFTGDLELTAGGAITDTGAAGKSGAAVLQAKSTLFPRGDGAFAVGASAGALRDTGAPHGSSAFQSWYARALASWYPHGDTEVDLNLGVANVYGTGTFALAGVAVQYMIVPHLQLLAETYRDAPGPGKYAAGVRYAVLPGRFEAYASYGARLGRSADDWSVTVGIRVQTAQLLP